MSRRTQTRIPEALAAAVFLLLVVGVMASAATTPTPAPTATPAPAANRGPASVTIDKIKNLWEGVNFNHASHVGYAEKCASCHHHQPEGSTLACYECHRTNNAVESPNDGTSLKAAFHKQCIGCHSSMGAGPTGCADCHAKRAAATPTAH
jgi:hypothetical protein